MEVDYNARINFAKNYIERLRINLGYGWTFVYSEFEKGNLGLIDKIALLHPEFIKNVNLPSYLTHLDLITLIQGKRSFKKENGECQCELLWGYRCSEEVVICHGDHLFPYSLGGPSISENKLLLCKYHNMVKGTDIHLFPWDVNRRLFWVDNQIKKIAYNIAIYL